MYNNYTIRYPLYYSLRRREPTSDEREKISTFFLKIGFITYKWYVLKEKKLIDCVPFTLHWSDWIPENVAYVKSIIDLYDTIYQVLSYTTSIRLSVYDSAVVCFFLPSRSKKRGKQGGKLWGHWKSSPLVISLPLIHKK